MCLCCVVGSNLSQQRQQPSPLPTGSQGTPIEFDQLQLLQRQIEQQQVALQQQQQDQEQELLQQQQQQLKNAEQDSNGEDDKQLSAEQGHGDNLPGGTQGNVESIASFTAGSLASMNTGRNNSSGGADGVFSSGAISLLGQPSLGGGGILQTRQPCSEISEN